MDQEKELSFAQQLIEKVERILRRYMKGFEKNEELEEFMQDDKNLYNEDGSLTEAYKKKIAEVEDYVQKTPIEGVIREEIVSDEKDKAVLRGIIEFINRRREIMKEFEEQENLYDEDFDADKFIEGVLERHASTKEERQNILNAMEDLAVTDALEPLDDARVLDAFKEIINSNNAK